MHSEVVLEGQPPSATENYTTRALGVNQNSKAVAGHVNNKLKLTLKPHKAADLGGNSLEILLYERVPFSLLHCFHNVVCPIIITI